MAQAAVTPTAEIETPERQLTDLDRCDRCGNRAYARADMSNTASLLFCGHHWRDYGTGVRAVALLVVDETNHLPADVAAVDKTTEPTGKK